MKASELSFKAHPAGIGGIQATGKFKNGWGYSVIQTEFSYGGKEGKYELAVIGKKGGLHYSNPVAKGDVRGYLTLDEVEVLLTEIENFGEEVKWNDEERL